MTPEERLNGLKNGLGAMSELARLYYDSLLKVSFREDQAFSLTRDLLSSFIKDVIPNNK